MLASLRTAAVFGIEAVAVSVEVDVSFGLPGLVMVGLPDAAVRESRDRVRSAIRNSGFAFPQHRVTVNLAPADVRKAGAAFDLPIALGVLAATGIVTTRAITDALLVGELSLDGSMQPTRGVLPIAASARRNGCHRLVVPSANAAEASIVEGLRVLPVNSLQEAVDVLNHAVEPRAVQRPHRETEWADEPDLADVQGQALGRRALEVAAAGGHNLLLVGPPGAGKTMLARRLPGLLPPLTFDESLEVMKLAWTGEPVTYQGLHFSARDVTAMPTPLQQPYPPLWLGGNSKLTRRRVVEQATGWLPMLNPPEFATARRSAVLETIDDFAVMLADVHEHADRIGRTEPIEVMFCPPDVPLEYDAADLRAHVEFTKQLADLGVQWIAINGQGRSLADATTYIQRYADAVVGEISAL